jgi:sucrose phosphorylase
VGAGPIGFLPLWDADQHRRQLERHLDIGGRRGCRVRCGRRADAAARGRQLIAGPAGSIRDRLLFLYGEEAGQRAHLEIEQLIASWRRRLPRRADGRQALDQRDAILITYGDTFLAGDLRPLDALHRFAGSHLRGLVSSIHVLPFFPYSSDYGFAVIDYLEVDPRLGDWNQVSALGQDYRLMFDFVLNHVSAKSRWFKSFLAGEPPYDRFFITVDPKSDLSAVTRPRTTPLLTGFETASGARWVWTTFGPDQVDLDYSNPEVLLRMVDVLLTYVERGASLIRMDAIAYLWKQIGTSCVHLPQTHQVVKLFRDVLDLLAPQVLLVTETNVPHTENISYFGDGQDEAQLVYQFPLAPLVLDAFSRGDATRLARWAASLSTPSAETAFFNFLASHDGIGVVPAQGILSEDDIGRLAANVSRHGGEISRRSTPGGERPYELNATWFDALSDPAAGEDPAVQRDRFLASQAIMLALAGVPGIYVHSLFGSHNDHGRYAESGWKRDLNHGRLELRDLAAELSDPESQPAQVFAGMSRLLQARRSTTAFHPKSPQQVMQLGTTVFALLRAASDGERVLALHNVAAATATIPRARLEAAGWHGGGIDLLSGRRMTVDHDLELRPYGIVWLQAEAAS